MPPIIPPIPPTNREKTETLASRIMLVLLVVLFVVLIIFIGFPGVLSGTWPAGNNRPLVIDSNSVVVTDTTRTYKDTVYKSAKDSIYSMRKDSVLGWKKTVTTNSKKGDTTASPCTTCAKDRLESAYSYFLLVFGALLLLLVFPRLAKFGISKDGVTGEFSPAEKNAMNKAAESEVKFQTQRTGVRRTDNPLINDISLYDPHKGLWGGKKENNFRKVIALFEEMENEIVNVALEVRSTDPINKPLSDYVIFHLHPTFRVKHVKIYVIDGVARLTFPAWGAFTAGIETDQGNNTLEIDLAEETTAPTPFKNR